MNVNDFENKPMTLAEVEAMRRGRPIEKGKTRLELKTEATPLTKVDEKAFKAEVWHRDKKHCRCCGRKVAKTLERIPERGEVNHIHGRIGALRFEPRSAILLCLRCHERCTGRVKDKLLIIPTKTFELFNEKTRSTQTYTDARFPVVFKEVA